MLLLSHRRARRRRAAAQIQPAARRLERDAQVPGEERPSPPVMVAAHERDRNAAGADLLQLGDRGKVFAGMTLWYSTRSRRVARQHEVVAGPGHLVQKGVEGVPTAAGT